MLKTLSSCSSTNHGGRLRDHRCGGGGGGGCCLWYDHGGRFLILVVFVFLLSSLSSSSIVTADAAQECSSSSSRGVNTNIDGSSGDRNNGEDVCDIPDSMINEMDCGLYFAIQQQDKEESSIGRDGSGDGVWGMFAGRDYAVNEVVFPDLVVNIVDLVIDLDNNNDSNDDRALALLKDYLWSAHFTQSTFDADRIDSIFLGSAVLAFQQQQKQQQQPPFHNIRIQYDVTNIGRGNSSAGAFSHLRVQFMATQPIPAGSPLILFETNPSSQQRKTAQQQQAQQHPQPTSVEWLQQHGTCVDHIRMKPSQHVPHQQGAFWGTGKSNRGSSSSSNTSNTTTTTAILRKGQTVLAPIPVVPIPKQSLVLPDISDLVGEHSHEQAYKQLLVNFCYGHAESSLLLLPLAPPAIHWINHAPSTSSSSSSSSSSVNRLSGGTSTSTANVALRWSSTWTNQSLLQLSPQHLFNTLIENSSNNNNKSGVSSKFFGLFLEVYALRDIELGEELLLDYSPEWERAWHRHDAEWQLFRIPRPEDSSSSDDGDNDDSADAYKVSPRELLVQYSSVSKENNDDVPLLPTLAQGEKYYFPSHIQPHCWIDLQATKVFGKRDTNGWYTYVPSSSGDETSATIDSTFPCDLLSVDKKTKTYRIIVHGTITTDDSSKDNHKNKNKVIIEEELSIKQVPRQAITLVDKPYHLPQFLRRSFRHEIYVPDSVFPEAWKDLREEQKPSASLATGPATINTTTTASSSSKCGLYMAESAIPNSGLGMYTARPIAHGDRIFYGDVVVQVEDYTANNRLRRKFHRIANETPAGPWLLHSYFWNPSMTLAESEADDIQSIVPGLGMLANSHTGLVNAELVAPMQTSNSLHRAKDVGAGASSIYHDIYYYAPKDIRAGEELFVKYGDAWFKEREDLGNVPLGSDFVRADQLLNQFWHIIKGKAKKQLSKDVWDMVMNVAQERARLAAAFPKKYEEIESVLLTGTAHYSTPNRFRSLEWLEENGRCLDNIRPGDSTIFQAGRGAFATRRIAQGTVIAPVPVVQILRRDLEIYDYSVDQRRSAKKRAQVKFEGKQLLLNYCYGHPSSSILLFPYAPVVNYVNHNHSSPNAKLRWSTLPYHKSDWLKRSPEDLAGESHAGLILELVALRDIQPHEEVFLDYGDDWTQKWREFELAWYPPQDQANYVPAWLLNKRMEWLRTEEELETDPYPYDNVWTACFVGRTPTLVSKSDEPPVFQWTYKDGLYEDTDYLLRCEILERDLGDADFEDVMDRRESIAPLPILYTVRVHFGDSDDEDDEDGGKKEVIYSSVPREAIRFFDNKYTSDLFLRNAFRHEIQLPDDLVPKAWRDLE